VADAFSQLPIKPIVGQLSHVGPGAPTMPDNVFAIDVAIQLCSTVS
jgi:hypothetical protein